MYIMYVHSHTNITQLLRQTSVGILLIILVNRCCVEMGDVHICKTQQMAAQDEHIASLLPTQHCASMVLAVAWCLSVTSRYCIEMDEWTMVVFGIGLPLTYSTLNIMLQVRLRLWEFPTKSKFLEISCVSKSTKINMTR